VDRWEAMEWIAGIQRFKVSLIGRLELALKVTDDGSRFFDVLLSFAVARHWPDVTSNAVSPGWVATKMGGSYAPGSMKKAVDMLTWLAVSEHKDSGSGNYYAAQDQKSVNKSANNERVQEEFLRICEEVSGVSFPKS
jgi:hypothetical protein